MGKGGDRSVGVGAYIRREVLPAGLTVTEAAARLGVSRPALSNLLNGKASLSPEMAARLQKAFGADGQKLLLLQESSARNERVTGEKSIAVGHYVPAFMSIKARHVEQWASTSIEARDHLPVFLRRLVHSTGRGLRTVDFPGYDNAQRRGWDGWVDADEATPWIPGESSGWEFGTDENPRRKADGDYAARLKAVPREQRHSCTFVFVTPRNWPGKVEWAEAKNNAGEWKAVRAFDASDLEQWLEESIPTQMWLAERLGWSTTGFRTLGQCWQRWALAAEPPMPAALFAPSIVDHRGSLKGWLEAQPDRPFVVAADSTDEALAFLACLFDDDEIAPRWRDLASVFESVETLIKVAGSSAPLVPVVYTAELERELAQIYRRFHCIVVRPRNAVDSEPQIALDLLGHEAFQQALGTIGISGDDAERLERESGRSPTTLRRRLSKIDAIRTPQWSSDSEVARPLVPMALVGAWNDQSSADCEIVSYLAGWPYQEIEAAISQLRRLDDAPVWAVGRHRGVTSKIDALFALSRWMTRKDLEDFFFVAECVLSESDPALELPEDRRWVAGLYGKIRAHSGALRQGVCETLVILAVHGNGLFRERLGVDVDELVSQLIRRLLTPLTLEKLLSQDRDLPQFAEASPEVFLRLIEDDLRQPSPVVLGLLKPASNGMFGGCLRTGLLWALEGLAWKPQNLPRVIEILGALSRVKIDDNWANKPIASLQAIFRSWLPQTAALLADRERALEALAKRHPEIGWRICIEQFERGMRTGTYSHRPRWRNDAAGAGRVPNRLEDYAFCKKALEIVLDWPDHNEATLGDLVERLAAFAEDEHKAVWRLVEQWADKTANEHAKAALRERIRVFALTRRGQRRGLPSVTAGGARRAYGKLEPSDVVVRHAWLFVSQWIDESIADQESNTYDPVKAQDRIRALRDAAVAEVWAERQFGGILDLLNSGAPVVVGYCLVSLLRGDGETAAVLRSCLDVQGDLSEKVDECIRGILLNVPAGERSNVVNSACEGRRPDDVVRLLRCAPFDSTTWSLVRQCGSTILQRYWAEVVPTWANHTDADVTELVDRLLDAGRPRAAFHAAHLDWERVETLRLKNLLLAVATGNAESAGHYRLDPYQIAQALKALDGRAGVSSSEMGHLEFVFLAALDSTDHGIPNLERQISREPALFVQAVALVYKRKDGGEDPPALVIDNPDQREIAASSAYRLLDQLKRLPGRNHDREQGESGGLLAWIVEVRRMCSELGRDEAGDHCIGQLLAKAAAPADHGLWPCRDVCDAMEAIASPMLADGFVMGTLNLRGAVWRGEGGEQERHLAARYRGWSQQLAFDYPFVSGVVERVALSYEQEGAWEDSRAQVRRRLDR